MKLQFGTKNKINENLEINLLFNFIKSLMLKYAKHIPVEPDPASTDCWAQGSVPKQIIPPRPISPVAEIFEERPDDEDEDVSPL